MHLPHDTRHHCAYFATLTSSMGICCSLGNAALHSHDANLVLLRTATQLSLQAQVGAEGRVAGVCKAASPRDWWRIWLGLRCSRRQHAEGKWRLQSWQGTAHAVCQGEHALQRILHAQQLLCEESGSSILHQSRYESCDFAILYAVHATEATVDDVNMNPPGALLRVGTRLQAWVYAEEIGRHSQKRCGLCS